MLVLQCQISKDKYVAKGFFLNNKVYIFVNNSATNMMKVIKLSKISKNLVTVFDFKYRICFCACDLIDKIYIIGGEDNYYNNLNFCI